VNVFAWLIEVLNVGFGDVDCLYLLVKVGVDRLEELKVWL